MINDLLSQATKGQPTPTVGMGATILMHSDRHAATITSVMTKGSATYVSTRDDSVSVVKGSAHDGSAVYAFSRDDFGCLRHFRADSADGRWHQIRWNETTRRWNKVRGGVGLRIGERDEYRDPHF